MKFKISKIAIIYIVMFICCLSFSCFYNQEILNDINKNNDIFRNSIIAMSICSIFYIYMIGNLFFYIDFNNLTYKQAKRLRQYIIKPNLTKIMFSLQINILTTILMIFEYVSIFSITMLLFALLLNMAIPSNIYTIILQRYNEKLKNLKD